MRVLIDTNVLFSALYRSGSISHQAYNKAINPPYQAIVCDSSFDELYINFSEKFPELLETLVWFIETVKLVVETIPIPKVIHPDEAKIRDPDDAEIFRASIAANVDIIITGDLDLLESGINAPKIMKPNQFLMLND
ncbi:MAG: putative toxin-antitoxin system toxin component, PIN family [Oscillospiraceae bacterium]|jgi:putative PIN family toxin of toxin-antitoxin system|nr:putative toxin-antitoxin system toxin component, PIN family [Oscillospiraceae bacterium]